jgi:hypothetical protein
MVYNRRDGTTQIGTLPPLAVEYNEYLGSDTGQWAGTVQDAVGRVDRYALNIANTSQVRLVESIPAACVPQFYGASFGYLTPYQAPNNVRTLIVGGVPKITDTLTTWAADRAGGCYVYTVARGTRERRIFDQRGNDCTIRTQQDETPWLVFVGPNGLPWIVSWTPTHTFVRMIYSASGFAFTGDFLNADCRVIGARAHLVGSLTDGTLREAWIDFNAPMVDLRKV